MFLLFFLLWIIFNGSFTPEIGIIGLFVAAALFGFACRFMGYSAAQELRNYKRLFLFLRYVFVLVKEIVAANFGVIRLILTQKEEPEPMLIRFRSDLKTPVGRGLLANAITLTPGTITVTLEEDRYTVHCLDESMAEGLQDNVFADYIRKLEENGD